jgi:hypothetical protein
MELATLKKREIMEKLSISFMLIVSKSFSQTNMVEIYFMVGK